MRQLLLAFALLASVLSVAQVPTFSTTPIKAAPSVAARVALASQLRAYERGRFDGDALVDYLRAAPGSRPLRLTLGSHDWDVRLESFDLRAPGYTLVAQTPQGPIALPRTASPTFRGTTADGARVVVTVAEGFISGWVAESTGAVHFQSEWLHVPGAPAEHLVVYAAADEIAPAERGCEQRFGADAPEGSPSGKTGPAARPQVGQCFQVQLAVASDYSMYQKYGSNVATLEARNLSVMAGVEGDYGSSFADDYFFPVVQQFVSTCSSCDPWTSSTDAGALLTSFTNWGGFTTAHDLGQLWTNRNFAGSTVGIAWVGAVCTFSRYHTISDFTPNAAFIRVTTSHEIGHNFDCDHDASGSPHIMAPAVQNTSSWSAASIATVNSFGPSRSCLASVSCGGTGGGTGGGTPTSPPVAAFLGTPRNICPGGQVNYQNNSTGATSYQWTFIGGTPTTSTQANPTVTYTNPGTFNVILVATNSAGSNTKQEFGYVTVDPAPTSSWNHAPAGGLTYQFTNTSTNATNYRWDFGDGTTSFDANPTHTFPNAGVYSVTLAAISGCGLVNSTQTVVVAPPPAANFTASLRQGCAPLTVLFNDASTGNPTSFQWTFTGGTPSVSTARNPAVTYSQPGTYDVRLVVGNSVGTDTELRTGYVTVLATPTAGFGVSLNGATVSIVNQASASTGVSYAFGDGATSSQPNPTHTYTAPGNYTITQTVSGPCGPVSATQQVTIIAPPTAGFTVAPRTACIGSPVTINSTTTGAATAFAYVVTAPDGTTATFSQPNFTYVPTLAGAYTIRLTASNAAGSDATTLAGAIAALAPPTANFNVSFSGTTAAFQGSVTPVLPGAGVTYSWDFGDGQTGAGANPSHTYASPGTYTVRLTAFNGCTTDTETRPITVGAAPNVTVARQPAGDVCVGANVTYVANVSGAATSVTWALPGSNTPTAAGTNVTTAYAQPGSYTATVTVCNAIGCNTASLAGGTTVLAAPVAAFTVSVSGATVTVTSQATGNTGVSYTFAPGATATTPTASFTYAQAGTHTITQAVTGPCGQNTTTRSVTIGGVPNVTAGLVGNGPFCVGEPVALLANVSGGATTVTWSIPGAVNVAPTGASVQVAFTTAGTYTATVTACNAIGCSSPVAVTGIVVAPAPTANFTAGVNGLGVTVNSTAQSASSVTYDFGDGSAAQVGATSYTYATAGNYVIVQTATSRCGTDTAQVRVTVGGAPGVTFTGPARACVGTTVTFTDQSSGSPTAYLWSFPGGSPATSTARNPTVTYAQPGTYDVTLRATNAVGSNTQTRTGAIRIDGLPTAAFTATVAGATVTLTSTLTSATGGTYDFGNGDTAPATTATYTYAQPGTYTIRLTANGPCGTANAERTIVIASPTVLAGFTADAQAICPGETVRFSSAGTQNATSFSWQFPGGSPATSSATNPSVTYDTPGVYTIVLVASNGGSRDTLTRVNYVEALPLPQAAFVADVDMLSVSFDNQSTAATSYTWSFGDANTSTAADPTHTYASAGTYSVQMIARGRCGADTFQQAVTVNPALPNAAYSVSVAEGCSPLVVTFEDRSTGAPTAWLWTLNSVRGLTLTSAERNPSFTLVEPDLYTVTLQVSNAAGVNSTVDLDAIRVYGRPEAEATLQRVEGMTAFFTSASTLGDSLHWDFGDGSSTTLESPRHAYATAGTYEVVFSVFGRCGVSRDTVTVTIVTSGIAPGLPAGASVALAPNPAHARAVLRTRGLPAGDYTVEVSDIVGRLMHTGTLTSAGTPDASSYDLPVADWAAGTYLVRLRAADLDHALQLVRIE